MDVSFSDDQKPIRDTVRPRMEADAAAVMSVQRAELDYRVNRYDQNPSHFIL
jgi:hypothetical protein